MNKRALWIGLVAVAVIGLIILISKTSNKPEPVPTPSPSPSVQYEIIGKSVEGRNIESYTYGAGDEHLVFIGGIHGGYEWNSVVLAYNAMDYLETNKESIPENLKITIIPSMNPDGVYKVLGKEGRISEKDAKPTEETIPGRFNAHNVDLNRNFDCKWQPESTWRGNKVSAGTSAFSEPEAQAIRDYMLKEHPSAVVFWHSQAGEVYTSECEDGISDETRNLMKTYAKASGYKESETFDYYAVTGDAEGWLARVGIPTITVELKTHENVEWDRNLAGMKSIINYYGK
ncbi:MAG: hypothetical protein COU07_00050 [Candidatus Harrisonbacteria bacterium CG10_big_fil_rev_8_21_14_0_10_40_38]|uniref:Peptidase M14 domain-containing protein n=1 Tax=Candidatus Harrisonbacteria bacterium CG10_big_fil_rev_8_21_14_0_10_40_38 TaxID=1974583 RepID=A0A2H0US98_9BACT|nr:MAG: hypothetical protein COU07_00050 [Candidatus Harrisonbacteria bacterium CG10_big_fil_rev_8_21_14_0_10_40_38]